MAYAAIDDITTLYGPDALYNADRDRDGEADLGAVDRALQDASDVIDSFLTGRYDLPRDETPGILRKVCVDIALYDLAGTSDVMSETTAKRHDAAIATLKRIASGEQSLPRKPTDLDGDGVADGPKPVVIEGPDRLFSRAKLRDY